MSNPVATLCCESLIGSCVAPRPAVQIPLAAAELWSVARPYLYTLRVEVLDEAGNAVDAVNVTTGVRTVKFDADKGLLLNEESVKVRGFCDHSNW